MIVILSFLFILSETLTWTELKTSGQMLPPRAGHATVAFGKNLFVFGGFTDSQNLYDDLYMLDVGMHDVHIMCFTCSHQQLFSCGIILRVV